jgi:hypothetical protein
MRDLTKIIHAFLAKRHGDLYASEKVAELTGKSTADILHWACVYLDPRNQASLMAALNLHPDTPKYLRRAFDAAAWAKFEVTA